MKKSLLKRIFAGTLAAALIGGSIPSAAEELAGGEDELLIISVYDDEIEALDDLEGSDEFADELILEDIQEDLEEEAVPDDETESLSEDPAGMEEEILSVAEEDYIPEDDALGSVGAAGDVTDSGSCGRNLTWTLTDTGVLTISGTGAMWNWEYDDTPWWDVRTDIVKVIIESGVTSIGVRAFQNCISLTGVDIQGGVTSIGDAAFLYCDSLTSIELPDGLKSIGQEAFRECSSLTGIEIPDSVISIGCYAFAYCSSLTGIDLPGGLTGIEGGVFMSCESLKDVRLPDSAVYIGESAFAECTSLTGINLPDGLTDIGKAAFCDCSSLTGIDLPDSVWDIGDFAFSGCTSLTDIVIPDGVMSIGNYTFSCCGSLTDIELPGSIAVIGSNAFVACTSLTSIDLPSRVTIIGDNAFASCHSLKSIEIPSGVTIIGDQAFDTCNNLREVVFTGDAPVFEKYSYNFDPYANTFRDDTLRVVYPWQKSGWTEEVRQQYGGNVTWVPAPTPSIELSSTDVALYLGESTQIKVSGLVDGDRVLSWKSDNTSVATVSSSGFITAEAGGTATVTVTLKSGLKESVKVTVKINEAAPAGVRVFNSRFGGDINWKKVNGAVGYVVYRSRSAEGTKRIARIDNGNTLQYYDTSIRDNCYGRVYNYYVRALYRDNGKIIEGPDSEKVVLQRLAPMQITSASNYTARTIGLKWKCTVNENKALGYEIGYAESYSDLANRTGTYKTKTLSGRNSLSTSLGNLKKGKTYWIRIRCYVTYTHSVTKRQTKTWSQFSNIVNVKVNK